MDIFMSLTICFLSAYGAFRLLYELACYFACGKGVNLRTIHTVIPVTNKSKNIEGYIRYLALKNENENVILLNMATDVEIIKLIRLLAAEFDFVYIMTREEYLEYVRDEVVRV